MRERARVIQDLARTNETALIPADAALLRDGAARIGDAGVRTRSIGTTLSQLGERFMRSVGR